MDRMEDEWVKRNTYWTTVKCAYLGCDEWVRVPTLKGHKANDVVFCQRHKEALNKW